MNGNACDMPCNGLSTDICGGDWANKVLSTAAISKLDMAILNIYSSKKSATFLSTGTLSSLVYVGCFKDNNMRRDLNGVWYQSGQNTIESCIGYCLSNGFRYAGAQYG